MSGTEAAPKRLPTKPAVPEKTVPGFPGEISTKKSRASVRDSVMRVNSYQDTDEPADIRPESALGSDPLGNEPLDNPAASEEIPSASDLPATEPAAEEPPVIGPAAQEPAPLRPEAEPFPDDPGPQPPSGDLPLPSGDLSDGISTAPPSGPGCQGYGQECVRAIRELQERDITTIAVGVIIEGVEGDDYPCDCRLGRDYDAPKFAGRNFSPTLFTWKAAATCHKPLYFEDVHLERYGHSWNPVVQPFASAAHFFISVPLLPYKMGLNPPGECMYTLGYYRPGSCAPYMFEPIPFSLRAAAAQAAGVTAFTFWFWPPG